MQFKNGHSLSACKQNRVFKTSQFTHQNKEIKKNATNEKILSKREEDEKKIAKQNEIDQSGAIYIFIYKKKVSFLPLSTFSHRRLLCVLFVHLHLLIWKLLSAQFHRFRSYDNQFQ